MRRVVVSTGATLRALDQSPESRRRRRTEVIEGQRRGRGIPPTLVPDHARRVADRIAASMLGTLLPQSLALPAAAAALRAACPLLPVGRRPLGHRPGAHEGELEDAHGAATVAARLGIGKRPVAHDAGPDGVSEGAPLGPARDAHALGQLGGSNLAAVAGAPGAAGRGGRRPGGSATLAPAGAGFDGFLLLAALATLWPAVALVP